MRRLLPLALLLLVATPALASAQVVLTLDEPLAAWTGRTFGAAAWPHAERCPALVCDRFEFLVALPDDLEWPAPPLAASIAWDSPEDDFDLYLYDGWGFLVTQSVGRLSQAESVYVDEIKPGTYTLVVVPTLVVASGYDGRVELVLATS